MTNISLHFPQSIEIPDKKEEQLFAPFCLQSTLDGKALLSLRISKCTQVDTIYVQYLDMYTKSTSFCSLSDHFETYLITDFTIVNEKTIVCGRFFDYIVVEFTDSSFSTISECRRLGAHLRMSNANSLQISERSFALGATVYGEYLYAAIAEEDGITATGVKTFKVRRFNRSNVMRETGVVVAESRGWSPLEVWQNGKIIITPDGFIELVSRDLCNIAVIRLRLDQNNPSNQQIDRCFLNLNFTDEYAMLEYSMGNSSDPSQQHCETPPQSIPFGKTTVSCHPEGIFSHQLIRRQDGIVKEQKVNKILPSLGRLSSMCLSQCNKYMYTITIINEHDYRMGQEFTEVWRCDKYAILDDDCSLENIARRSLVLSMADKIRKDSSIGEVLYNSPRLFEKIIN